MLWSEWVNWPVRVKDPKTWVSDVYMMTLPSFFPSYWRVIFFPSFFLVTLAFIEKPHYLSVYKIM